MPNAPMTYAEKVHLIGTALTFLGVLVFPTTC